MSVELEEGDDLYTHQVEVEKRVFDCSLKIKKLLQSQANLTTSSSASSGRGVRLPKLDVPTFDGNILNWRTFWDQFLVSVHDRTNLSESKKLVYLQQALKEGSAKRAIEGLSRSGEHYSEAIKCLKSRYDCPRLTHQAHVKMIVEAPSLKDGNGREICCLHDTVQQHLRALKAIDYDPSGLFITSVLELKLDANTMFEWQKHSHDTTRVPHYQDLLEFLNLRAQASETSISEQKKPRSEINTSKRSTTPGKPITSFTSTTHPVSSCILCKSERHPLYACSKFKALPHDKMISTLKSNGICMNCLGPGHFVKQCKSLHRCKKCQKPHHSLLHLEERDDSHSTLDPVSSDPSSNALSTDTLDLPSHATTGLKSDSLLMTCRVLVSSLDSNCPPVEARAILDCASSASFISERLAQSLCLPRLHQNTKITGVACLSSKSPIRSITKFGVSATQSPRKTVEVTAVVVPHVTCDLPVHPISLDSRWNHLSDVKLADPDLDVLARLISSSVWKCSWMSYFMAGGWDHLIHQSPSRPSLAGC